MSVPSDKAIREEALRFLNANKDKPLDADCYPSPRVSSELPDCSMPLTFDQFKFCSLGCTYCFAYNFKMNTPGAVVDGDMSLKAVDADRFLRVLRGELPEERFWQLFFSQRFLLHWGGMADPFCVFEDKHGVGMKIIEGLAEDAYPTLFSFKGSTIQKPRYMDFFEKWAHQSNFAFQVSMVSPDDKIAAKVEIGVPSTTERIETLRRLSAMGYWTILRLRPFIIGVTDEGLDDLLERCLDAGINAVSMEFFAMDGRCSTSMKQRQEWLGKLMGIGDVDKYFKALSPKERGGYMRLNRKVKEPHVRKVWDFCAKHGLTCGISDPDFKELNTSGSCCGMPDAFPRNPEMCNWSKNQLTYHLARLRKEYHATGVRGLLRFEEVYPTGIGYLDRAEGFATNQHVGGIGLNAGRRWALTLRHMLQEKWNNLRSPSNPRNYLDGKLLPVGIDANGDHIYQYNVHDYELRWTAEGVDLTR